MSPRLDAVLLIDDNEADNFFHRLAIEEAGCVDQVLVAESGAEALELLRRQAAVPELILLDINMPAMNAWEFLEALDGIRREARENVVLLTTSSAPEDQARAERAGLRGGMLGKPLTQEDFLAVVERVRGGATR